MRINLIRSLRNNVSAARKYFYYELINLRRTAAGGRVPAASIDAFIREAGGAADVRGLTRLFERVVEKFGFDVFSYHIIRSGHQPVTEAVGRRIRTPLPQIDAMMPDGARLDDDPITADALRRFAPVHWFEQEHNPKLSTQRRELYRRLHDAGFEDGIAVPVSSRPGEVAIFSFSARNRKFRFSDEELKLLQHACHAMNARWNELAAKEPPVDLSPREMEVMALVASGRSNQEIAGDLAISAHTVDTRRSTQLRKARRHQSHRSSPATCVSGAPAELVIII